MASSKCEDRRRFSDLLLLDFKRVVGFHGVCPLVWIPCMASFADSSNDIEDDAVPAVFAHQGPVDAEQHLFPRTQFRDRSADRIKHLVRDFGGVCSCIRRSSTCFSGFRMIPCSDVR